MPVIVHGVSIPPVDSAPGRDSFIGDVLGNAVSKQLKHPSGRDCCDLECLSYIAEACCPPRVGSVGTQCLIPAPFGGPLCCRLSDGELLRACIFHESVCSCHYYSELPQLIFLLLKNRSSLRRISYSLFKR
jgi:hypothetical protein